MSHRRAVPPPDVRPSGQVRRPEFIGSFPYAGTSGYAAGSDTSEERARTEDADGRTSKRQARIMGYLDANGTHGATWFEIAEALRLHHGQASGALSGLHRTKRIARLAERRGRCAVYVLPGYVNGRDTQAYGRAGGAS
jgi:hypothetical protein